MIKAEVLADSKNQFGDRITTMIVTFPRHILAELNTHRMLSRNSASSRAIPFEKMLEMVKTNPFMPIAWQANHKGMQGTEYLSDRDIEVCKSAWLVARDMAVRQAEHLGERGLTKQMVNRMLEPYMWHTAIITATEWENFFALRCPQYTLTKLNDYEEKIGEEVFRSRKDVPENWYINSNDTTTHKKGCWKSELKGLDWLMINKGQAEIHMMALAEAMWDAMNESTPRELQIGEWHVPKEEIINELFGLSQSEVDTSGIPISVHVGTVFAARTSYTVNETDISSWNLDKYTAKCVELSTNGHWSPFEHCAKCMSPDEYIEGAKITSDSIVSYSSEKDGSAGIVAHCNQANLGWSGNFKGFVQYRKLFTNENITKQL